MIILMVAKRPTLKMLRENLQEKENGFSTLEAQNGPDGLKKFVEQKPDLIILDPSVKEGEEFLEQIQALSVRVFSPIPIIVILQRPTINEKAKKLIVDGVDAYLERPINFAELLARIKNLLHLNKSAA